MIYDAGDRRISQTVDADGAASGLATTEHYIYDGEHIILEFIDADGPSSAAQPISEVRNLFGPVIDMILAQEQIGTGETNWVLTDHLGTIRDLIGNMGQQVLDLQYDSFGNLRSSSSPTTVTRYGFTGREFDNSLGLYYYRARYYSPELGRFLQEDPIAYTAQDANLYRYVFNQPAEHTDPSGRILPLILAGIWAGAEVGLAIYDSYDTASTIMDPCASTGEKFVAGGLWAAGAILPGGGYSQIDNVAKGVAKNVPPSSAPQFSGTSKPWTSGATPNSKYTHVGPDGKAVQNAIYDGNGNVIGHVDFKNHGPGAPSGHGHQFPIPGNPASGHGPGKPHIPPNQLPPGWGDLPPGVPPRTPIGQ
jgi:RHS repeat-associated protein